VIKFHPPSRKKWIFNQKTTHSRPLPISGLPVWVLLVRDIIANRSCNMTVTGSCWIRY